MQVSKKECIFYIMTGNCLESENCTLNHPKLRLTKKSKLKFKNKSFKPKREKKRYDCLCCKDNPYKCRKTPICNQFGRCICISQKDIDQIINSDRYSIEEENDVCQCCLGNFFTCENSLCSNLGMCQCQMRKDIENNYDEPEDNEKNYFIQESAGCSCCKGFVFNCQGKKCKNNCYCFM